MRCQNSIMFNKFLQESFVKKYLFSLVAMSILFATTNAQVDDFERVSLIESDTYSDTAIDKDGNIYVVTELGLLKSSDSGITWVSVANDLDIENVQDLEVEADRITVLSNNVIISANSVELIWESMNGPNNEIMASLRQSTDGSLFVQTESGKIFRYDSQDESFENISSVLSSSTLNDFEVGLDGELVIVGDSGIDFSTDGGVTFDNILVDLGETKKVSIKNITCIEFMTDGTLMLASNNGFLRNLDLTKGEITEIQTNLQGTVSDLRLLDNGNWIATTSSAVNLSTDGKTFTEISSGTPNSLNYSISADGDIVIAGDTGVEIRNSNNPTVVESFRLRFDGNNLLGMGFGNNNEVVAISTANYFGSIDAGTSFDKIGNGISNITRINDITTANSNTVVSTDNGVFTSNQGSAFALLSSQFAGQNVVAARQLTNGTWMVGTGLGLFSSTDGGITFSEVNFRDIADLDSEVTSMDIDDNGRILVANNSNVYVSADNGVIFNPAGGPSLATVLNGNSINNARFMSNGEIFITTSGGTALGTNNGLSTTVEINGSIGIQNADNALIDNFGNFFVQGEDKISVSTDGGTSFNDVTSNTGANSIYNMVLSLMSGQLFALTDRGVMVSLDNGASFDPFDLNINTGSINSAISTQSNTIIVATNNGIVSSTDNGVSFDSPQPLGGGRTAVRLIETVNGSILAATDNGIMISTDDGQSFIAGSLTGIISSFEMISNGGILARTDTGVQYSVDNGVTFGSLSLDEGFVQDLNINDAGVLAVSNSNGNLFIGTSQEDIEEYLLETEAGALTLSQVVGLGNNMILGSTINNRIVSTIDGGVTFSEVNLSNDVGNISDIKLGRDGSAIMLGQDGILDFDLATMSETLLAGNLNENSIEDIEIGMNGELVITNSNTLMLGSGTDGNMATVQPDLTKVDFNVVEFDLNNNGKLATATQGGVMISENFGKDFSDLEVEGRNIIDVAFAGDGGIISIGEGTLMYTNKAGKSTVIDPGVELNESAQLDSDQDGNVFLMNGGMLMLSTDDGDSFNEISTMGHDVSNLEVLNGGTRFASTSDGVILMWDDQLNLVTADISNLNFDMGTIDFAVDSEDNIYISSTTTGVWRSEDKGKTFTDFNIGLTSLAVNNITSSETGFVYVVTQDGLYYLDVNEDEFVAAEGSFSGDYSMVTDIEAIINEDNTPGAIDLTPMDYYETIVLTTPSGLYFADATITVEEEDIEDSVRELDAESVFVYPMPASSIDGIQITMNNSETVNILIVDAAGNKLFDRGNVILKNGDNDIDFDGLPRLSSGSYYVSIVGESGMTTIPVVVKR